MVFMVSTIITNRQVVFYRLIFLLLVLEATCSCQIARAVVADPALVAVSSRLSNISTRAVVQIDNDVLVGGFIVSGTGAKQLLLRALGPTLSLFGVTGALLDPVLELRNSTGALVASNDNWETAANAQSIPENLRPPSAQESAILVTLDPGSYTAIVRGVNNTTGSALVEAYDLDTSATSRLTNISTRGLVLTDSNVMIAGVIVQTSSEKVIVRALGPTLASFGITNSLANPALELHDTNGSLLAANDNWKTKQQTEIIASGHAPSNDLESAIVSTLAPGNYTAIVRGVNSMTGVAPVEVYALQTPEVWIAVRSDGLPGSGTKADPYDGSTAAKFDVLMNGFRATSNLGVHLIGPGPFRTDIHHTWVIGPGWQLTGDGMYATTVELDGSAAGIRQVTCLSSNPNISTDNVTISDLTVDCNWSELSTSADTGADGEKNITVAAVVLWGNNNLIERVRSINTYGTRANKQEHFAIGLSGPRSGDGTNNIIQSCRAELPQGNYGNPFSLGGSPPYLITNSRVLSSTVVGINDGLDNGFTSGGVNLAYVKNCQIDGNTFIDCQGAAYQDTGSCDGLMVTNNTVIRGCIGVGLWSPTVPKRNVKISGNNFQIQNRYAGGASYGIFIQIGQTTDLTISNNTITFDTSGSGQLSFWGIAASSLVNATVSDNIIEPPNGRFNNAVTGSGVTFSNNHDPNGNPVPGL
jgi:hypothetical protein